MLDIKTKGYVSFKTEFYEPASAIELSLDRHWFLTTAPWFQLQITTNQNPGSSSSEPITEAAYYLYKTPGPCSWSTGRSDRPVPALMSGGWAFDANNSSNSLGTTFRWSASNMITWCMQIPNGTKTSWIHRTRATTLCLLIDMNLPSFHSFNASNEEYCLRQA